MRKNTPKINNDTPLDSRSGILFSVQALAVMEGLGIFFGIISRKNQSQPSFFFNAILNKFILILVLGIGVVGEGMGQCPVTQPFFSNGSFPIPVGVTSITIEAWGGGGAGGGSRFSTGGGGGGGAYSRRVLTNPTHFTPGQTLTVRVGGGGIGVDNADGGDGNLSNVMLGANLLLEANGGKGGKRNGTGGLGGTGTITNGEQGDNSSTFVGGSGGNAGNGGNGGDNGDSGQIIGGGGGGSASFGADKGGNGARGEVRITYNLPPPTAGAISGAQTICSGGDPVVFTSTSAGSGSSYKWESAVSPFGNSDFTTINGANAATYNVPSGLTVTTRYRRISITAITGCESAPTPTIEVTVQSVPTPGAIAGAQEICSGGNPAAFTSPTNGTGAGTISYRWEYNTNLTTPNWSPIGGASSATYDPPAGLTATTQYRRWTISRLNGIDCQSAIATTTIQVTISPNPSASPATATVCAVTSNADIITQTTQGVTSIGTPTGLPTGVTASFSGGIITISGTPTVAPGDYSYSIPLNNATCSSTGTATGIITVENCACEDIVYDSPGTFSLQVPTGVISISIEAWGGGGGGGGSTNAGNNRARGGAGGGGGAYSTTTLSSPTNFTPGQTLTINVGAGGAGGTSSTNSVAGNPSSVINGTTPLIRADGGSGGASNTGGGSPTRGFGGNSGVGTITAGSNGTNGATGSGIDSGRGGNGGNGGNGGPSVTSGTSNGNVGLILGGGGGGARTSENNGARTGGNGARGEVRITYTLSAGTLTGYPYVCVDQTTPYESDLPGGGGLWSSSNDAVATVDQNGVVTGESAGSATIFYTVYGSCATAQTSRAVFVTAPIDPGILAGNQEVCVGGTSTFTSNTSNGTWTSDNTSVATVHPTTGLVTGIAAGTATISYTLPQSGICPPVPGTRTVTVTAPPIPGTLSGEQAVCVGGTTTFSSTVAGGIWTSNNPLIATINASSGLVTGVSPGTATMTYTVAGTGGCTAVTATRTATITAIPTAGTLNGNPEACVGETPTFSSNISGGTWLSSDPLVATIDPSSGLVTAIAAGTAIMTYTITGTGNCADVEASRDITVHALPTPTITGPAGPNVCINEQVTYTTDPGMDFYFWIIPGVEGEDEDYVIISGGTDTENTVTLEWKSKGPKSVGINYADTNGCAALAEVYSNSITVDPNTSIDSENLTGQIICDGDAFAPISVEASGPGTLNYQWYKNTTNSTSGGTPVGTDSDSYLPLQSDFSAIGNGSPLYYYVVVSQTGGCGNAVTSSVSGAFIVKELVEITTNPSTIGGIQCFGDGFGPISVTATGSDLTYQWYSNTTDSNTGGTIFPGATSAEFTPPSTTTLNTSYYYYAVVTGYCEQKTSDISGAYTVTPPNTTITVDLDPNVVDEVRCIGDDSFPELMVTATGEIDELPAVNYQWYRTDSPVTTGGTLVFSETESTIGSTYTPQADEAGTWYYYVMASSDCGTVPSAISGAFIVNPNTQIDYEELDGQIICEGDNFDPISIVANNGFPAYQASLNYQWYSNTVSAYTGSGLTAIPGANTASFTPPADVPGSTLYYFVVVSGDCGPDVTSSISGAHYVTPNPTVGPGSSAPEVCVDQAIPTITHTTTNAISIGTALNLPDGVTASFNEVTQTLTLSGTPTEDGTFNYTIPVLGCDDSSIDATGTITVNPEAEIVDLTTIICSGESFNLMPSDGTDGEIPMGTTYTWTVANNPNVTGDSDQTVPQTGISQSLAHNESTAQTVVYTVTPSTPDGCIGDTFTVSVTVNPVPAISPMAVTICSSDTDPFTVSPVDGIDGIVPNNTTYTWVVVANGNVTGESNQTTPQPTISQTLTNTGTTSETVVYTVTPTSGSCPGDPFTVTVTVNPTPTVTDPSNQEICTNSSTSAVSFTGNAVAGVVYNWTNDTPSIGLAASGTGNIPSFIATNTTENDVTATITVTPSANGCDGLPQTFTITVYPSPIKSLIPDYCAPGGEVGLIASANKPGTTWLWSTGETTSSISVKIAGTYSVTATTSDGCVETRSIPIAQELVINGDFTDGNTVDPTGVTGFNTGYDFTADVAGDSELVPEGRYGIGPDARTYHNNFWGSDHTNNTVGARNMMIVNGYPGSNSTIIWEQEVTVRAGVDYYFSAYAMSLNDVSPYAKLRFEVNGEQVGTTANLGPGERSNSNDGWEEFYGIWPSTVAGTIKIRIVNLEPAAGGNDFALDDLSFGTLSTFITLTSGNDTDDQVVCQDFPIDAITYSVGSGVAGPVVTNLPPGVTTTWNGVTLLFSGTPTAAGDYTYTITTTGVCSPATATGRIIVRGTPEAGEIAADQTVCFDQDPLAFTSVTDGTSSDAGATISYRWESNTNLTTPDWDPVSGDPAGSTYDPPVLSSTTQYRRITLATNGTLVCESEPTVPVQVTVQAAVTSGTIEGGEEVCSDENPEAFTSTIDGTGDVDAVISYRWEYTNATNPTWTTIPSEESATYDPPILSETTQYRRITVSTLNGVACMSAPTNTVEVAITPDAVVTPVDPDQNLCVNRELSPPIIIHNTTGASGIVPESAGLVDYNLPNGVIATWTAGALPGEGVISIAGTPNEMGVFDYSIPLEGCGLATATGTIFVDNPSYPISQIDVVNPTSLAGTSSFTVHSPGLTPGTYEIIYSTTGVNGGADEVSIEVTVLPDPDAGKFILVLPGTYSNEGTSVLTINSIQKTAPDADLCRYYPPNNNTAVYGLGCSTEFLQTDGNDEFYVPADVYEVRIESYEGAVLTNSETIAVNPGGVINIGVIGNDIFATGVPLASATAADWIVSATAPDARLIFHFDCNPPVPDCPGLPPYEYTDSEGFTVLRFDVGACEWHAPDGLDEFEILIVGGGGGGGFGNAAGGGGGGAVMYQHYTGITTNGLPGLQNAVFPLSVGTNGAGAIAAGTKGGNGQESTFDGPVFESAQGTFSDFTATGGGGGGSTSTNSSIRTGSDGASGGGGAASGTDFSAGGTGNAGTNGGTSFGETSGTGGGGGGGAAGSGIAADYTGIMNGGAGGIGDTSAISGGLIYYGAGGGGTSSGAITNEAGAGGSPYGSGYFAGGSGTNHGVGQSPTTYGSGGGAGRDGGGAGFPGVIYIRYPNYRILPVEYLYFNATYEADQRTGNLTWATANEWENDRFEIQRAVNDVKEWETIGEVAGAGYSESKVAYDYTDNDLPASGGNIFYRLKQFDFDGDSAFSVTRSIQVEPIPGYSYWKVYPNPTTGDPLNLELIANGDYNDEPVTVRIIAATGQFGVIETTVLGTLSEQVSDWLWGKAAGVYTLEISWGDKREYHKIVLRR